MASVATKELIFPKRARKSVCPLLDCPVLLWESRCGGYRVVLRRIGGLAPVYRAGMFLLSATGRPYWSRISNHRKLASALRACQHEARNE